MAAIKSWARSIFILSLFASTVVLLIPKSMTKQAKFVAEMLLLLCVIAPLAGLLSGAGSMSASPDFTWDESAPPFSLEQYMVSETIRRIKEVAVVAELPVEDVQVVSSQGGYGIREVRIVLSSLLSPEDVEALRSTFSAYLLVPVESIVLVAQDGDSVSR